MKGRPNNTVHVFCTDSIVGAKKLFTKKYENGLDSKEILMFIGTYVV